LEPWGVLADTAASLGSVGQAESGSLADLAEGPAPREKPDKEKRKPEKFRFLQKNKGPWRLINTTPSPPCWAGAGSTRPLNGARKAEVRPAPPPAPGFLEGSRGNHLSSILQSPVGRPRGCPTSLSPVPWAAGERPPPRACSLGKLPCFRNPVQHAPEPAGPAHLPEHPPILGAARDNSTGFTNRGHDRDRAEPTPPRQPPPSFLGGTAPSVSGSQSRRGPRSRAPSTLLPPPHRPSATVGDQSPPESNRQLLQSPAFPAFGRSAGGDPDTGEGTRPFARSSLVCRSQDPNTSSSDAARPPPASPTDRFPDSFEVSVSSSKAEGIENR